ncbi:TIGR03826 family flagellar region protein [Fervidibacillus halotolerans]|uniref:Flagellar protein n=1 Tax=Fervidibacillus halotolerans TaxID=2980027 RepID=A0A9E8RWR4_9BACI|nr:TIGR03826 family flagellar region protein [Fervidibacillus halotolerans]WAA12030.1 hypothetical protein OE105_10645 [Fervidibacillus halotolerans]
MKLENCSRCGRVFVKTSIRDVCDVCYQEEEAAFEKVNNFLKKRENRTASMAQVIEATGVEEELILKFIRKGRIRLIHFPNLSYPCEKCGAPIQKGKLCEKCQKELRTELEQFEQEQKRQKDLEERTKTYYAIDEKYRKR